MDDDAEAQIGLQLEYEAGAPAPDAILWTTSLTLSGGPERSSSLDGI